MTTRERMMAAYGGKIGDKPALGVYARYLPRGEVERTVRNLGMGIIEYVPLTTQIGPPWHRYPGFLSPVDGAGLKCDIHWKDGHKWERRTYTTPVGSVWQDIGASVGAGSEHIGSYYLKEEKDYVVMKYLVEHTELCSNEALYRSVVSRIGEDGVVMGRMDRTPYQKLLLELAGGENFLLQIMDNSDLVEDLMDAMGKRYHDQINLAMESCTPIIWIPDNVTVDMTPPKFYEKYLLKHYEYLIGCAHQTDKIVVAHYDGRVKPLLPFLRRLDLDVIESVSAPTIGGDLTYAEWLKEIPGKVVLPNFPSNLCSASDEEIHRYVRQLKSEAEAHPFMLQISEDLEEGTWQRVLPLITEAMYDNAWP